MSNISILELACNVFLDIIKKAQEPTEEQTTETPKSPLISGTVTLNVASINGAISKLNSAFNSLKADQNTARAAIMKLVNYLMWYRTVGQGGDLMMGGKQSINLEEFKIIVRTGLFSEDFIMSLAALLQMGYNSAAIKSEFSALKS
jgi:hypothetical protein